MHPRSSLRAVATLAILVGTWLVVATSAGSRFAIALSVAAVGVAIPFWYVRHC